MLITKLPLQFDVQRAHSIVAHVERILVEARTQLEARTNQRILLLFKVAPGESTTRYTLSLNYGAPDFRVVPLAEVVVRDADDTVEVFAADGIRSHGRSNTLDGATTLLTAFFTDSNTIDYILGNQLAVGRVYQARNKARLEIVRFGNGVVEVKQFVREGSENNLLREVKTKRGVTHERRFATSYYFMSWFPVAGSNGILQLVTAEGYA